MRPFGCHVTILNTLDPIGKFDGKADEGFLVGYSINSKAFRVFNTRTRKVEENLHINFLENKPNVAGSGPEWLFDIDSLTKSMNYEPVTAGNQTNGDAGIETNVNAGQGRQEKASDHEYIFSQSTYNKDADEVPGKGDDDLSERNGQEKEEGASNKEDDQHVQELDNLLFQQKEVYANNTNRVSTVNPSVCYTQDVNTARPSINTASENINTRSLNINTASPIPNDPRGHTPGSDEGRLNFNELINLCTQLSNRVLALENSKTAQDLVIQKLKRRVKRFGKGTKGKNSRDEALQDWYLPEKRSYHKTKPMFNDSNFDVLDDAMENVEGAHGQLHSHSTEEQDGKKDDSSSKQAESSKHDEESVKKQKLEDEAEREELRACLDIVPGMILLWILNLWLSNIQ
ncbi:hypothetical protein Tco_1036809 [Tanacetum coccineum]